jgi:peptide/nickel transport system substrate-binding protein
MGGSLMRKRLFGVLASAAFVFAACGPAASPSPSSTGTASQPTTSAEASPSGAAGEVNLFNTDYPTVRKDGQAGGTVIFSDWQEATEFQPFYASQVTETNVYTATSNTFVTQTYDFKYANDIADGDIPTTTNGGVKVPGDSGDAMTVTWKIKSGLKWSDGEDLNCDDFAFTQDWVMDKDNTGLFGGTSGYEDIKSVDCPDPATVVYHYSKIYEGYLGIPLVVLPEHYFSTDKIAMKDQVAHKGTTAADMPKVPVSGPFKFESITPGSEIRMVRNDQWKNPAGGQPAYLDALVWKWYGDADAMIAGYKSGEFDIGTDLNDADLPKIVDQGDAVVSLDSLTYEFLRPNWGDTCSPRVTDRGKGCPTADPAIREAIRWAVNKDDINTRLLGGNAALGFTNVAPTAWFYSDPPTYTFDPEKAKSVLEAAGWKDSDGDGVREKDGLKAKIELCTTTRQVRQDTLALVAAWLKDVGIDSVVNAVSPDDIFASFNESTDDTPCVLSRHKFDLAEHAFSVPLDPLANFSTYHSGQEAPNGGNDAAIEDPDVDRILDGVKGTVEFAEIKTLMAEWQKIYVEKTMEIPLYFRKDVSLRNTRVSNFTGNPTTGGPMWNVGDWFVTQ